MFPVIDADIEKKQSDVSLGKSFLYDFHEGDFVVRDGRLVVTDDLEAMKVWIDKVLRTERFRFLIYNDYGVKLEDLFGGIYDKSFLMSELRREIKEALTKHPLILNVINLSLEFIKDKAVVSFDVITDKASFSKEVVVNG